jgi:hypothetical protein
MTKTFADSSIFNKTLWDVTTARFKEAKRKPESNLLRTIKANDLKIRFDWLQIPADFIWKKIVKVS